MNAVVSSNSEVDPFAEAEDVSVLPLKTWQKKEAESSQSQCEKLYSIYQFALNFQRTHSCKK